MAKHCYGLTNAFMLSVTRAIEARSTVELAAIGIGHNVGRYYRNAITIRDVRTLAKTLMTQLADVFAHQR